MLTYTLEKTPGVPLYEALYRCIREDILSGNLAAGEKLPSKRALAANLKVSKITVEGAYSQLLAEGYISAKEKVGYFVEQVTPVKKTAPKTQPIAPEKKTQMDLTANGSAGFPFSIWSKLQRQVMLDLGQKLLLPLPNQGLLDLRRAIAGHLSAFRGMEVSEDNIFIGAGTDFLYNLLIQLLGRDICYGVEEPGYEKIRKIYTAGGVNWKSIPMDSQGVIPEKLTDANVLHISPSHHFPTGIVTPLVRRQALLAWAEEREDRWIIEDDYDSEFRFGLHPMPTMQSLDHRGKVIYMNTFSMTLAPSIRISYMILPAKLMEKFRQKLGFYSGTVPSFEQYTLARFLQEGYFEKHLNRMRKFYKARRNRVLTAINSSKIAKLVAIEEADAGLHFILRVKTQLSDEDLVNWCARRGLRVRALSSYFHHEVPEKARHCLVINYSGLQEEELTRLEDILN